jgi:hypothetical protein
VRLRCSARTACPIRAPAISVEEQRTLLHAIDVWWLYAGYAGIPRLPLFAAAVLLAIGAVLAWVYAWRMARAGAAT